jgi:geranylgeranyl pyrophosphate synthase
MWQERPSELLRNEIEEVLKPLAEVPDLCNLVSEPLKRTRRALNEDISRDYPWPLLPLMVSEAICGHYEQVVPAAAGLEFLLAAGDVFDDIEDNDAPESLSAKYGSAIATNVATTLLILGEKSIPRLKGKGLEDQLVISTVEAINSFYTTACGGQHMDISITPEKAASEEVYLMVTASKSASQVECACHIGALLARADQDVIHSFTMFGNNLGMAAQITNDIQGIISEGDIFKRKITLPIIYALSQADDRERQQLVLTFKKNLVTAPDSTQIKDLLFRTGAVHYAMVKLEYYRQRARDILLNLEKVSVNIERLMTFLT